MAFLVVLLLLFTLSCQSDNDQNLIENYNRATFLIPQSLNPIQSFSTVENSLCEITLEGLFSVNKYLEYSPLLAKTWTLSSDKKTYTITLKKGVLFHNNKELKSQDVIDNLDRLIQKDSPVYNRYKRIHSVRRSSDYVLKIRLSSPYPPFLALLSAPAAKIHIISDNFKYPIGTGPFIFHSINTKKLQLIRNNNYHGKRPRIKKLNYIKVDEKIAKEGLAKGTIHDTSLMPYLSSPKIKNNSRFILNEVPAASTWIIALNTSVGITKDVNLRRCLIKVFKKKQFINNFIPDHSIASNFLPPTILNMKNIHKPIYPLKCFGQFKGTLRVNIPIELEKNKYICKFLKLNFDKLGINTKCNAINFGQLIANIRQNKSNAYFLAQTLDLPYVEYFFETFQEKSIINLSSYSSREYDNTLDQLRSSEDRIERVKFIHKLEYELQSQAVTLNISYPKQKSYWHKCLTGYYMPLPGEAYIDYKNIDLKSDCELMKDFQ